MAQVAAEEDNESYFAFWVVCSAQAVMLCVASVLPPVHLPSCNLDKNHV